MEKESEKPFVESSGPSEVFKETEFHFHTCEVKVCRTPPTQVTAGGERGEMELAKHCPWENSLCLAFLGLSVKMGEFIIFKIEIGHHSKSIVCSGPVLTLQESSVALPALHTTSHWLALLQSPAQSGVRKLGPCCASEDSYFERPLRVLEDKCSSVHWELRDLPLRHADLELRCEVALCPVLGCLGQACVDKPKQFRFGE